MTVGLVTRKKYLAFETEEWPEHKINENFINKLIN